MALPPEMLVGALLRDNEYGWKLSAFPAALAAAEKYELACLGGQLQFRVDSSVARRIGAMRIHLNARPKKVGATMLRAPAKKSETSSPNW